HVNAAVPSVSEHSDLPTELDGVFQKALAKRPTDRYATCAEFVAALRAALDEAARTTRPLAATTAPTRRLSPVSHTPLWPLLLGGCGDALTYLQRADRLEPGNADVQNALQRTQQCLTPTAKEHGKHKGHKGHD